MDVHVEKIETVSLFEAIIKSNENLDTTKKNSALNIFQKLEYIYPLIQNAINKKDIISLKKYLEDLRLILVTNPQKKLYFSLPLIKTLAQVFHPEFFPSIFLILVEIFGIWLEYYPQEAIFISNPNIIYFLDHGSFKNSDFFESSLYFHLLVQILLSNKKFLLEFIQSNGINHIFSSLFQFSGILNINSLLSDNMNSKKIQLNENIKSKINEEEEDFDELSYNRTEYLRTNDLFLLLTRILREENEAIKNNEEAIQIICNIFLFFKSIFIGNFKKAPNQSLIALNQLLKLQKKVRDDLIPPFLNIVNIDFSLLSIQLSSYKIDKAINILKLLRTIINEMLIKNIQWNIMLQNISFFDEGFPKSTLIKQMCRLIEKAYNLFGTINVDWNLMCDFLMNNYSNGHFIEKKAALDAILAIISTNHFEFVPLLIQQDFLDVSLDFLCNDDNDSIILTLSSLNILFGQIINESQMDSFLSDIRAQSFLTEISDEFEELLNNHDDDIAERVRILQNTLKNFIPLNDH